MKAVSALAMLAAIGLSAPAFAADEGEARLKAAAEACIRDNASSAERVTPEIDDAANFLIEYLCAREVARYGDYIQNLQELRRLRSQADSRPFVSPADPNAYADTLNRQQAREREALAKAYVDPDSGEIVAPAGGGAGLDAGPGQWDPRSDLRAIAGHAVLEARIARLKAEGK